LATLPFALAEPCSPLEPDTCPTLQLVIVHRFAVVAAGHDQHSCADRLIADVGRGPRIPRTHSDARGLSKHGLIAIGYLVKLCNGCGEVAAFGGYRMAVPWSVL
jgi:hypothetical protein